ncbi:MAG: hypothetical protein WAX14_12515 [Rhodococcus sp. (in: high G+C Gram-positive bacteria)]|uniref:hypothetical protein n=1 Tax=Rhodococcus sp. TaxID=1831 RepID=UPI003BB6D828
MNTATLDDIRANIRTAYDLVATDERAAVQYARAAHSLINEASHDPEIGEEAAGLAAMIVDFL